MSNGVTTRHTHIPSAERDEDGMWEVDCAEPECVVLVSMRLITSRYPTEALAVEAAAAIITMIGE
jgi:hypothetical protein